MARKQFDAAMKDLVEVESIDWLALAGRPPAPAKAIDADLATVSSAADKVLRVKAAEPYLFHMEFAVGHDGAGLPAKLNARNALLEVRHGLPVRSVAILLKPEADSPQITGRYEKGVKGEPVYRVFCYDVIRVWQLDVQTLLNGGIGTVPLAPVAAVSAKELPAVLAKMEERFEKVPTRTARDMWETTSILMSLRYENPFIRTVLQGVRSMEVQSVLHDMMDEERLAGRRETILLQGEARFGPPSAANRKRLEAIEDSDRLRAITLKVLTAKDWKDLLAEDMPTAPTPAPAPRRKRRPKNGKES